LGEGGLFGVFGLDNLNEERNAKHTPSLPGQTWSKFQHVPKRTAPLDRVEATLVDDIERAVRAAKALPPTRLTKTKLTPQASAELLRQLLTRGLERGPQFMRVPLSTQIEALVQGGARVPLKDVSKRVKGGTKAEINAVLAKLVREGRARVVVRTQLEVLAEPTERALDTNEIASLSKLSAQLVKTLKKVQAKGLSRSILHEDLIALFAPLQTSLRGSSTSKDATSENATSENATSKDTPHDLVEQALRRLEDPKLKLVRIPDLVRSLAGRLSLDAVHRALAEGAKSGTLELRPEAGTEFLKPEDVSLCPPGPRGTVFSFARLVSS
jgi:hypothetical protein